MHIESISGDAENTAASRGISRRSVMKVGAAAAWSVPLVQVVAAAPAHATSGQAVLDITGNGSWGIANDGKPLNATVSVANTGGQSATLLTIVLSFPAGYAPTVRSASLPTGWAASGNGTPTVTLSSQGTALAPEASFSVTAVLDLANANNRGKEVTVGLAANASGGISGTGTLAVAKG
jgi:hypothetical protein